MNQNTATDTLLSECRFATGDPAKYIRRLCKHFNHKVPAEWDEVRGQVRFPMGDCQLTAGVGELVVQCRAPDTEAMAKLEYVLEMHIEQIAWREAPRVVWQRSGQL